VTEC